MKFIILFCCASFVCSAPPPSLINGTVVLQPLQNIEGSKETLNLDANKKNVNNSSTNSQQNFNLKDKVLSNDTLNKIDSNNKNITGIKSSNNSLSTKSGEQNKYVTSAPKEIASRASPERNASLVTSKTNDQVVANKELQLPISTNKSEKAQPTPKMELDQSLLNSTSKEPSQSSQNVLSTDSMKQQDGKTVIDAEKPLTIKVDEPIVATPILPDRADSNDYKNVNPNEDDIYSNAINDRIEMPGQQDQSNDFLFKNNKDASQPAAVGGVPNNSNPVYKFNETSIADDSNSHFFAYLLTLMVLAIMVYLVFHNKKRIIALVIEGRSGRSSQGRSRRNSRARYHKLDNNLEEAMSSTKSANTKIDDIY